MAGIIAHVIFHNFSDKDCPADAHGGASESTLNHANDHDDTCSFQSEQMLNNCTSNEGTIASHQSVAESETDTLSLADTEHLLSEVIDSGSSNSDMDSLKIEVDSDSYNSDNDTLSLTDSTSDSDSSFGSISDTYSESVYCTDISDEDGSEADISSVQLDVNAADQALTLMSCFLRNKLSTSACRDVIETLKTTFKTYEDISALSFNKIMAEVDTSPVHEIHYCTQCYEFFPNDKNVFQCLKPNCDG